MSSVARVYEAQLHVGKDTFETAHDVKDQAVETMHDAKSTEEKAQKIRAAANKLQDKARAEINSAESLKSKASALRKKAQEQIAAAEALESKAGKKTSDALAKNSTAIHQVGVAKGLMSEGKSKEGESKGQMKAAGIMEANALKAVARDRLCVDLPGVWLGSSSLLSLHRIVGHSNITTPQSCTLWCQEHATCKQCAFSFENKTCELFGEATVQPIAFRQTYNSSYCGKIAEKEDMLANVEKVFKMKPWVPDAPSCAWGGDSCLESKCCAAVCMPDAMFTKCEWYTCYKQDEYFAGCKTGSAPYGWNGTVLGGHSPREVAKAEKGILTQGTSLFCFCVVMWNAGATMNSMDPEGVVAAHFKKKGRGIFQCDDHMFVDGQPTGSMHNIDSFIHAWEVVRQDGRYAKHDWTVKVDADAVFLPDRLRLHINSLRPPQGSRLYLRNCDFKFHFLGAIEVLTREAVELYYAKAQECNDHVGKQGGEDYWMLSCLEGIGVDYQTDYSLLNDKYAAEENCNDDWAVAFHFYKKVSDWDWCWHAATNAR